MAGDHSYLVRIVHCQVGIYENENVGDCFGEGKSWGEESPCMRIRIEDYD
jgi:hypothetical protein